MTGAEIAGPGRSLAPIPKNSRLGRRRFLEITWKGAPVA